MAMASRRVASEAAAELKPRRNRATMEKGRLISV
jgi:hypothetical protein